LPSEGGTNCSNRFFFLMQNSSTCAAGDIHCECQWYFLQCG
jgi:hypothetical protein